MPLIQLKYAPTCIYFTIIYKKLELSTLLLNLHWIIVSFIYSTTVNLGSVIVLCIIEQNFGVKNNGFMNIVWLLLYFCNK